MKLRSLILAALLFLSAVPALSQGCAMCYSTAAEASSEGQKAIRRGVIVLLVPPLGFMSLGVWMASRYARRRDLEQSSRPGRSSETPVTHQGFVARPTRATIQRRTVL
jgi:hypothetical protein